MTSVQIQGHRGLNAIDISFSPCFSSLHAPFLTFVSEECRDTLTFFAASHVTGDIGLSLLSQFTNLRHLDISFTSISFEQCCNIFQNSTNLKFSMCLALVSVGINYSSQLLVLLR
eukprot:m.17375 g.17375  ORF g.17375 m.17375 type:complete len:115 (+) comp27472_c0_seq1:298-642(+)